MQPQAKADEFSSGGALTPIAPLRLRWFMSCEVNPR
jgi:hypothetical protein